MACFLVLISFLIFLNKCHIFFLINKGKTMSLSGFYSIVILRRLSVCLWRFVRFVEDSLVVICWERADLRWWPFSWCCFTYAYIVVYVPFSYSVWGRMKNSIVSVPDHCIFIYMTRKCHRHLSKLSKVSRFRKDRETGLWWWLSSQIPVWGQAVQPRKVASQIKGTDRSGR